MIGTRVVVGVGIGAWRGINLGKHADALKHLIQTRGSPLNNTKTACCCSREGWQTCVENVVKGGHV